MWIFFFNEHLSDPLPLESPKYEIMWIFLAVPSRVCERWVHTLHQYHSSRPGGSFTRIWNWPNLEYWEIYFSFANMELANPRIFKTKYSCFENIELANPRIFQKKYFTFTNMALANHEEYLSTSSYCCGNFQCLNEKILPLLTLSGWNLKFGGTKYVN